jgi:hypothetical protein
VAMLGMFKHAELFNKEVILKVEVLDYCVLFDDLLFDNTKLIFYSSLLKICYIQLCYYLGWFGGLILVGGAGCG